MLLYVAMCTIHTYMRLDLETDLIVTLGLFHFIGPANDYTCALHIDNGITRLG